MEKLKYSEKMIMVPVDRWNQMLLNEKACSKVAEKEEVSDVSLDLKDSMEEESKISENSNHAGAEEEVEIKDNHPDLKENISDIKLIPPGVPDRYIKSKKDDLDDNAVADAKPQTRTLNDSLKPKRIKKIKWLTLPKKTKKKQ